MMFQGLPHKLTDYTLISVDSDSIAKLKVAVLLKSVLAQKIYSLELTSKCDKRSQRMKTFN